ncbi:MAG: 1,4-dihydroxy-2-naphthoate octaprenyltransferase [Candidatus Anaerobiospirillum merdipullorum]|uniref:1,4-dihydroxy-2-naphthoate octaprenyltransferase n=1 Tax=Candidatus Anaerobiospirillum merdipullorum TaxID=2838450 RepID=A0A9E2NTU7_9GAMM|nr:1,4-dihydroxy-2-naphthoate octaprenyltransferase [Candidatus Anaerobiospirillum merdipullorum]
MLHDWLLEARLRTLLLSATNCAVGCALGFYYGAFNLYNLAAAICIIITAILLQILSNFANDYGDAFRGADRADRLGPIRAIMTGSISIRQLRHAMALVTLLACFFGLIAVVMTLGNDIEVLAWFMFAGVISIVAAIFYTVGMAYGYKGLGDISVFIFFGLLSVLGPQIMITNASGGGVEIYPDAVLLGVSLGAGSVMVLHVNNMRDAMQDKLTGKRTLATRLGVRLSAVYHVMLFSLVVLTSFAACFLSHKFWEFALLAVGLIPLMASVIRVVKNRKNAKLLAPELKFTALGNAVHNLAWIIVLIVDFWAYY